MQILDVKRLRRLDAHQAVAFDHLVKLADAPSQRVRYVQHRHGPIASL
jgi:hypothetical protein